MKDRIVIVAGDPNSINSEIIFKSFKKIKNNLKKKIVIIGNKNLLNDQLKLLKINLSLNNISNINEISSNKSISIIDVPLYYKNSFKVSDKDASKYVKNSLSIAHNLSLKKKIKGFINCPIDKKLIKTKNVHGVTEYLAKKSKLTKYSEVMLLFNKTLSVVPLTTHIKIKDVSAKIRKSIIIKKVRTINIYYKKIFKKMPKIAVLGLNPHNSELSKSSEEIRKIIPAIKILKKNYKIFGPFAADSFFINQFKNFNVVLGMYHDQVLVPFKNIFKFDAINITLGLKYYRISPDHGTAKDIILKKKANAKSIIECINFMNKID
tara:strand:- start:2080 stop:3042 length:963 start_codon:yes stop_codon:yes gene_type:complete